MKEIKFSSSLWSSSILTRPESPFLARSFPPRKLSPGRTPAHGYLPLSPPHRRKRGWESAAGPVSVSPDRGGEGVVDDERVECSVPVPCPAVAEETEGSSPRPAPVMLRPSAAPGGGRRREASGAPACPRRRRRRRRQCPCSRFSMSAPYPNPT